MVPDVFQNLTLNFINIRFEKSSTYEFLNEKFINSVNNQNSLTKEIEKLIQNKDEEEANYMDYSKKFSFYDLGEPPTEKIVSFILKLIKNKKP